MKIAFAYDSAYPWFNGGIERRRFIIAEEFIREGHEIHFFTMRREGMPRRNFVHNNIHYHLVGSALPASRMYINGKRNTWWAMKYGFLLFFKMLPYRFDFVDADSFPFFHTFSIWAYCKLRGSRFIMTWHEVWTKNYWKEYMGGIGGSIGYAIEALAAKTTDKFIVNSDSTMAALTKEFHISKKNIALLRAGVSESESRKARMGLETMSAKRFLVVGRLIPEKRIDVAVRAMKDVDGELLIAGIGPERRNLQNITDGMGIGKKIIFKDSLSREQLIRELRSVTALIVTSSREGLSMITAEALSAGTPVIISDKTMLPNEVKRMCIISKENDLGKTMSRALANSRKLRQAASKNIARAVKAFSAKNAVKVYMSLLDG